MATGVFEGCVVDVLKIEKGKATVRRGDQTVDVQCHLSRDAHLYLCPGYELSTLMGRRMIHGIEFPLVYTGAPLHLAVESYPTFKYGFRTYEVCKITFAFVHVAQLGIYGDLALPYKWLGENRIRFTGSRLIGLPDNQPVEVAIDFTDEQLAWLERFLNTFGKSSFLANLVDPITRLAEKRARWFDSRKDPSLEECAAQKLPDVQRRLLQAFASDPRTRFLPLQSMFDERLKVTVGALD